MSGNAFAFTGIICPECGETNQQRITDSRPIKSDQPGTRRRRLCGHCAYRYTTHERVVDHEASPDLLRGQAVDYARRLAALPGEMRRGVLAIIASAERIAAGRDATTTIDPPDLSQPTVN